MLILWIAALFLAEPLLFCAYALGAVLLNKDDEPPQRRVRELIAICQIVVIVMLYLGLYEELDSLLEAAVVTIMLLVANTVLRPIIYDGIVAVLEPWEHAVSRSQLVGKPWVHPGSHPPPGWDDEN